MSEIILFEGVDYYNHQKEVIERAVASDGRYGIFHEPGLGKTLSALTIAINLIEQGKIDRVEVIPPASLLSNWESEIEKFVPEDYHKYFNVEYSHQKLSLEQFPPPDKKTLLIVDESHNFSNSSSNRTKLLIKISNKFGGLLSLTGTPKTNSAIQLFYQSKLIGFDNFTKKDFIDQYCFVTQTKINYLDKKTKKPRHFFVDSYPVAMNNEAEFLGWFLERADFRKTEEAIDLPPQNFITRRYSLTSQQEEILNSIQDRLEGLGEVSDDLMKVSLHTIYQVLSGSFLGSDIENGKIELFKEILDELGDEQVVVFMNYKCEEDLLKKTLTESKISFSVFSGSENKSGKKKSKEDFLSGKSRVILVNAKSGREGQTFTSSHRMIFFSNTFELVNREQSVKRIHRIGQDKPCFYYDMVCEGQLDEITLKSLNNKSISLKDLFNSAKKTG